MVICQNGWEDDEENADPMHPCTVPICEYGCVHGKCQSPNLCTCDVGWEGPNCDICVPLPGCQRGNCTKELECNCHSNWEGAFCNIRKYLHYEQMNSQILKKFTLIDALICNFSQKFVK